MISIRASFKTFTTQLHADGVPVGKKSKRYQLYFKYKNKDYIVDQISLIDWTETRKIIVNFYEEALREYEESNGQRVFNVMVSHRGRYWTNESYTRRAYELVHYQALNQLL